MNGKRRIYSPFQPHVLWLAGIPLKSNLGSFVGFFIVVTTVAIQTFRPYKLSTFFILLSIDRNGSLDLSYLINFLISAIAFKYIITIVWRLHDLYVCMVKFGKCIIINSILSLISVPLKQRVVGQIMWLKKMLFDAGKSNFIQMQA